jgi:ankyrin repeat protein
VSHWVYHASQYNILDREIFDAITALVQSFNVHFLTWVSVAWVSDVESDSGRPAVSDAKRNFCLPPPSPLHVAGFAGLTRYAEDALRYESAVDLGDQEGRTPLWWAARRNHAETAVLLLAHGAKIDASDHDGSQPLYESAQRNHAGVVRLILEAGADPFALPTPPQDFLNRPVRIGKRSALHCACDHGHVETIAETISYCSSDVLSEMLGRCCAAGKVAAVQYLLQHSDVDCNAKCEGETPLCLAIDALSVGCVEALLSRGADAIKRGADVFASISAKKTLLHFVCEYGEREVIDGLLASVRDSDLERRDQRGCTVL